MARTIVWKLEDLPPRPQGTLETKVSDTGGPPPLSPGQFKAIFRFLASYYWDEIADFERETDLTDNRFNALLNALVHRERHLEYDDPPEVMRVADRPEATIHFYLAPPDVPRLTRGMIEAHHLSQAADAHGREMRTVSPTARIWWRPEGNFAEVEVLRDGKWNLIDFYSPER